MSSDRSRLKKAIIRLLDTKAEEHELGHQQSKAQRHVLTSRHGAHVEIMFEKNEKTPANFWCLKAAAGSTLIADLNPKPSPASSLRTKLGKDGEPLYGRHSALERMAQLGEADLVCFAVEQFRDAEKIIDRMSNVTSAELA